MPFEPHIIKDSFKVIGVNQTIYVATKLDERTHKEYKENEFRHILYVIKNTFPRDKFSLSFKCDEHKCPSEYCLAQTASCDIKRMEDDDHTLPLTHVPEKETIIDLVLVEHEYDHEYYLEDAVETENGVFSYSEDGGNDYYPSGHYSINIARFKETARCKKSRIVYVFKGPSALGKTYLASMLDKEYIKIYETDSSETLPDVIDADVVVVGNKYKFKLRNIKKRLFGDPEVVLVDFSMYSSSKTNMTYNPDDGMTFGTKQILDMVDKCRKK